jgi:hypothetical protein
MKLTINKEKNHETRSPHDQPHAAPECPPAQEAARRRIQGALLRHRTGVPQPDARRALPRRGLLGGGFGGKEPFTETEGVIANIERGSPTEEDRESVVQWLRGRQEVVDARAKDFKDAWHGYKF